MFNATVDDDIQLGTWTMAYTQVVRSSKFYDDSFMVLYCLNNLFLLRTMLLIYVKACKVQNARRQVESCDENVIRTITLTIFSN